MTNLPVNLTNISKSFATNQVLQNINIQVNKGEIFGLIGLNGIGKTTLIKIMLDLLEPDNGDVEFFGISHKNKQARSNISYLPEKFFPSPFLKGHEFLSITLSYYAQKLDLNHAKSQAKKLDLDTRFLDHKVSKYSKGMGQKLGLLSMFLSNRPLLLLDEPMSGLDPKARIRLKEMVIDYKKQGNTVFFSSHILSDIEELCDNIGIIHDGTIIFQGKAQTFINSQGKSNLEKAFLKAISDPNSA